MKAPKMEVIENLSWLLLICVCFAYLMVSVIDKSLQYWPIALLAFMAVLILHFVFLVVRLRIISDLPPLFARFSNALGNLKRLDTITRAWVIGILALCLLSMGFVVYVGFQNAAGVMPYAIATGVFTVFGIVFLLFIDNKTD